MNKILCIFKLDVNIVLFPITFIKILIVDAENLKEIWRAYYNMVHLHVVDDKLDIM